VGMVLGLLLYIWGQPVLGKAPSPIRSTPKRAAGSVALYILAIAGGLVVLMFLPGIIVALLPKLLRWLLLAAVLAAAVVSFSRWMLRMERNERLTIGALMILCSLNIVFWGVYEQQGNTMQLWADQNTNWNFLGFHIPSTWYQAFNPIMIFIFAPLLIRLWGRQAKKNREPSSTVKMAIGCFLLGLSFIIMILGSHNVSPETRRSVLWLTGTTFVLTIGELYLSPIGLSLVTKVSPVRMVSMMMGVWFLSSFFGNYLSGYLGTYWEKMPRSSFFLVLTVLGVGAGAAMLPFARPLGRIMRRAAPGESV
jgi:amino acid/peptide:H+ symporter